MGRGMFRSCHMGKACQEVNPSRLHEQGLIQAVFDVGIPILGTLIWECPNLILNKNETTIKRNSTF